MKKRIFELFLIIGMLVFLSFSANAASYSGNCGTNGDNLTWSLNTETGVLTISGTGAMADYETQPWANYKHSIKSLVIENGVTLISKEAFSWCQSLTSITIPDSVTYICEDAFYATGYSWDNSNWDGDALYIGKHLIETNSMSGHYDVKQGTKTIAEYAFGWDALTSVTIPDSVTSIGDYAFGYCDSLEDVELGNGITSIGGGAFYGCDALFGITIPDSVTSIGDRAFSYCNNLANITIPDSVASIGVSAFEETAYYNDTSNWINNVLYIDNHLIAASNDISGSYTVKSGTKSIAGYAFHYCTSLTSITIPNGVKSIGDDTFSSCYSLSSVTIPSSVTAIGNSAFKSCQSLASITIPEGVVSIGDNAFSGCGLSSITVPASVTSLGNRVFSDCTSLYSIDVAASNPNYRSQDGVLFDKAVKTLLSYPSGNTNYYYYMPDTVTTIADYAFYNCNRITNASIGNNVATIGDYAFSGCGMNYIEIPASVTYISKSAFDNCTNLSSIEVSEDNLYYCSQDDVLFDKAMKTLLLYPRERYEYSDSYVVPSGVTTIAENAFAGIRSYKGITISDSVTTISASAFSGCRNLEHIKLGKGIKTIGEYAFSGCSSITDITIPDSTTSIGQYAFRDCSDLERVTIGNGMTAIGSYVFYYCSSLESIAINKNLTSIAYAAFSGCNSISDVYYSGTEAEWNAININGANDYLTNATIHYGEASLPAMPTYSGTCGNNLSWGLYAETGVLEISGTGDMYNYSGWGNYSPWNNYSESIKSVVIKDGVTSIGNYAFYSYPALESVTIADSVTAIGEEAFGSCTALTSITIPNGVTSIGDFAFYYCTALSNVTIPDSVEYIGRLAFSSCNALTSVTIPGSVTYLGNEAFSTCPNLTSINVDSSSSYYSSVNGVLFDKGQTTLICCPGGKSGSYTIPNGVLTISSYAFSSAGERSSAGDSAASAPQGLTSITIPASVTTIQDYAFNGCKALTSINVNSANSSYSSSDGALFDKTKTTLICCPANKKGVYAIPDGVTTIGGDAFASCSGLTGISIPDSVTTIGAAFSNCSGLKSIIIPSSVTAIDTYTFYNCSGLESVTIPESVGSIGYCAFYECRSLKNVYYAGNSDSWAYNVSIDDFNTYLTDATIHYSSLPTASVSGIGGYAEDIALVYTYNNGTVNAQIDIANNAVNPQNIMIFVVSSANGTIKTVEIPEKSVGADSISISFDASNGDRMFIWTTSLAPVTNVSIF